MIAELLTKQDAHPHLEPHLDAIRECVERGWGQWREAVAASPRLGLGRKTTRANTVYDFVAAELETYFDSVGIINSKSRGYLVASLAGGQIEARFKKFSHPKRLTTSGIPTAQRLAIEYQQVAFDGMAVTSITIGYYPDELGIDLDVVAISCTYGKQLLWEIDLREDGTASAPVVPLQQLDFEDGPTVRSTRKTTKEKDTEAI